MVFLYLAQVFFSHRDCFRHR